MGYPEFNFWYQKEKNWVHFHFEKVERFLTSWPSPKNFSQLKRIFKQSLPRMLPKNVNLCSELFRVGFPSKTCYLCGKKGWYTKVIPQTLSSLLRSIESTKSNSIFFGKPATCLSYEYVPQKPCFDYSNY